MIIFLRLISTSSQAISPHCDNVNLLLVGLVRLPDVLDIGLLKVHLAVLEELRVPVDEVESGAGVPPRQVVPAHPVAQADLGILKHFKGFASHRIGNAGHIVKGAVKVKGTAPCFPNI